MIEVISVSYLIAIGILLIGIEALLFSFVFLFLGIGFLSISLISYIYPFESGLAQIALAFVIALLSIFLFRKSLLTKMSKESDVKEERSHVSGMGIVQEGMVNFDGTYWKAETDISMLNDGTRVEVVDVINNMVVLKEES